MVEQAVENNDENTPLVGVEAEQSCDYELLNDDDANAGAPQGEEEEEEEENGDNDRRTCITKRKTVASNFRRFTLGLLGATFWTSSLIFASYIFVHYLLAPLQGDWERWNDALPCLYSSSNPVGTFGMGLHLACGMLLSILGVIQLIPRVRQAYPKFHRWTGRFYLVCCLLISIGGLLFIFTSGTVGKRPMSVGFSLNGILVLGATVQVYRHAAVLKDYRHHELWAWRLFALVMASWLYRMEYTVAHILQHIFGLHLHENNHWTSGFDNFMDFFFYLPNVVIVEVIWRMKDREKTVLGLTLEGIFFLMVTMIFVFTTLAYSAMVWLPGIRGETD